MSKLIKRSAIQIHKQVPSNWYYQSLKVDPFQKYWHGKRFKEVTKVLENVDGEVLDIGCADGMFSKVILDGTNAKKLIGIDVLRSSISWAKKHWKNNKNMKFLQGDAQKLNFKNGTFSAVFAMEVLEHVHEPVEVFEEIKRILKKGGYAVFLVPSDSLLFRTIWFLWLHFYPRGWVWRETHIQTYRNNALPVMCKREGFKVEIDRKFNLGMLHLVKVRKT
jgi:2-polyprenyl-3-methyl-5-hydroxy-6-metoxy-1,4-benzoquinol methylase